MFKFRKFPTDWMLEEILNGVEKASNRALNFGIGIRFSIGRSIRGVRPYKTHRLDTAFLKKSAWTTRFLKTKSTFFDSKWNFTLFLTSLKHFYCQIVLISCINLSLKMEKVDKNETASYIYRFRLWLTGIRLHHFLFQFIMYLFLTVI